MEAKKKKIKQINLGGSKRINIRKEFAEQSRLRTSFERKLRRQLNQYFKKFYDKIANNFNNDEPYTQTIRDSQNKLAIIFKTHYRQVIYSFGERQLKLLEKQEIDRFETIYRDYVNRVGAEKVVGITATNMKIIQKVLKNNIDEGQAVTAKAIRKLSTQSYSRYRSATIARTETHNASSFANQQTATSMNIPDMQKRWVATQDTRSRSAHLAVNGTQIPIDEDFIVNGRQMKYPSDPRGGPANVINCRCVVIYITPDDIEL